MVTASLHTLEVHIERARLDFNRASQAGILTAQNRASMQNVINLAEQRYLQEEALLRQLQVGAVNYQSTLGPNTPRANLWSQQEWQISNNVIADVNNILYQRNQAVTNQLATMSAGAATPGPVVLAELEGTVRPSATGDLGRLAASTSPATTAAGGPLSPPDLPHHPPQTPPARTSPAPLGETATAEARTAGRTAATRSSSRAVRVAAALAGVGRRGPSAAPRAVPILERIAPIARRVAPIAGRAVAVAGAFYGGYTAGRQWREGRHAEAALTMVETFVPGGELIAVAHATHEVARELPAPARRQAIISTLTTAGALGPLGIGMAAPIVMGLLSAEVRSWF